MSADSARPSSAQDHPRFQADLRPPNQRLCEIPCTRCQEGKHPPQSHKDPQQTLLEELWRKSQALEDFQRSSWQQSRQQEDNSHVHIHYDSYHSRGCPQRRASPRAPRLGS